MANTKVLQLASLLGAISEGFAPQIYPNLARLGQAGREMAGQALMAEEQKKAKEAAEKKEKGKTFGSIGSIAGTTLGSFIPGVGPVVGATLGSLAGGTAGEAIGSGTVQPMSLIQYGINGAMNGLSSGAMQQAGSASRLAAAATPPVPAATPPAPAQPMRTPGMTPPATAPSAPVANQPAVSASVPNPRGGFSQNMQDWYRGGGAQQLFGPVGSLAQRMYDPVTPTYVQTKYENGRLSF